MGVHRVHKRHEPNRLPRGTRLRKVHTRRYNKQLTEHHIQVDVKRLTFKGRRGEKVQRFQYTSIDDATRVRAVNVYKRHTQANVVRFFDDVTNSSLLGPGKLALKTAANFSRSASGMSQTRGPVMPASSPHPHSLTAK